MHPPTPMNQLTELTVGSVLYGFYLNLFLTSIYILVKRSRDAHAVPLYRSVMFVLGCALFLAVTAEWVILVIMNFNGFITFEGGTAPQEYFANNRLGIQAALWGTASLSMILNDFMMVYRLWVVWNGNKVVMVLPILSWIGLVVTAIMYDIAAWGNTITTALVLFIPMVVFIFVTNFYCTGFIVWKIWRITRICNPENGTNLNDFLAMVVESSALYTAWILFLVAAQEDSSPMQYIAFGIHPMVAGMANALLQARIGTGKTIEPTAASSIHFGVGPATTAGSSGEGSREHVEVKSSAL
ncbi:hypothetical protein FB451DRAFT_1289463 [Mycena latifolia]|nr:hypothetical protein FB451DRAFT_1289463 [Mycena latifolia]